MSKFEKNPNFNGLMVFDAGSGYWKYSMVGVNLEERIYTLTPPVIPYAESFNNVFEHGKIFFLDDADALHPKIGN